MPMRRSRGDARHEHGSIVEGRATILEPSQPGLTAEHPEFLARHEQLRRIGESIQTIRRNQPPTWSRWVCVRATALIEDGSMPASPSACCRENKMDRSDEASIYLATQLGRTRLFIAGIATGYAEI